MSYITINEREYEIPQVNFDAICELEEAGVKLVGVNAKDMKLLSTIRGLAAWIMGVDTATASHELEEHILGGGDITEIMTAFMREAEKSGFFGNQARQNRQQRRQSQKVTNMNHGNNRGNGHPSRRS